MQKLKTLLLSLLISATSSLAADLSPERIEAAEKMGEVIGIDKAFSDGFEAMLPMIESVSAQWQLTPEQSEELKAVYRTWFMEDIDHKAVEEKMIRLWAARFTAEELEELTDFYSTPIGQKALKEMPGLMQEGVRIGMEAGQAKQAKLEARLQDFYQEHVQGE